MFRFQYTPAIEDTEMGNPTILAFPLFFNRNSIYITYDRQYVLYTPEKPSVRPENIYYPLGNFFFYVAKFQIGRQVFFAALKKVLKQQNRCLTYFPCREGLGRVFFLLESDVWVEGAFEEAVEGAFEEAVDEAFDGAFSI